VHPVLCFVLLHVGFAPQLLREISPTNKCTTMSASPYPQQHNLDLDTLEYDPFPTFVIKIADSIVSFEVLYCNEAFRREALWDVIKGSTKEAVLFRSWTLAIGLFNPQYEYVGRKWTATVAGARENWKIVRAVNAFPDGDRTDDEQHSDVGTCALGGNVISRKGSRDKLLQRTDEPPSIPLRDLPASNIKARWESLQTMMEMTDVGVFEYLPSGKLIHANDAWYRLRYARSVITLRSSLIGV